MELINYRKKIIKFSQNGEFPPFTFKLHGQSVVDELLINFKTLLT